MVPRLRDLREFRSAYLRPSGEGITAFTSDLSQDPGSRSSLHQGRIGEAAQTDVSASVLNRGT